MRKVFFIISLYIFTLNGIYSQITTTKIINKEEVSTGSPYDGTVNFLGTNAEKYVGQELYVIGKPKSLQEYGYDGFYTNCKKNYRSSTYKSNSRYKSTYSELAGKYFKVLEVIKQTDDSERFFLKLEQKESKEIVYFDYYSKYYTSFPFMVISYFDNLKKSYIGKEYIVRTKWSPETKDIKTGNLISKLDDKWKCVDLTIEEENFHTVLILENIKGEQIIAEIYNLNNTNFCFTKEISDNYEAKFGSIVWKTILEGNVVMGMTSEMCELSWGKPKAKNETLNSGNKDEQWVYSNNYLYFENGKLKTIQNQK